MHTGDEVLSVVCGYEDCNFKKYVDFRTFKRHLDRTHDVLEISFTQACQRMSTDSPIFKYFPRPALYAENNSFFAPSPPSPEVDQDFAEKEGDPSVQSSNMSPAFIDILGKIAFKHMYNFLPSKSGTSSLFSQLVKAYASETPSASEMKFAGEVFANDYRIKKFFQANYNSLPVNEVNISENSCLFFIDPATFYRQLLSIPDVVASIELQSVSMPFYSSILDGKQLKNHQSMIHLALYIDDFDPLIKSVYSGRSKQKVTGVYLKVLNISNHLSGKRSLLFPFCLFSNSGSDSDKKKIYSFFSKLLVEFLEKEFDLDGIKYKFNIPVCCSDNLAAHEILGLSTPSCSHPCRFCSESTQAIQENYHPVKPLIRTPENIALFLTTFKQLKIQGLADKHYEGVKDERLLDIPSLKSPFCFPSCISHDFFEKIIPDVLFTSLSRLKHERIIDLKFCIDCLNEFQVNSYDSQNRFNASATGFSGSSGQMRSLMRVFIFALKDILPLNHPLCKGIKLAHQIFLILNCPFFYKSWRSKLQKMVKDLLIFVRVDLNLNIYPKLHYLIHYVDQISLIGPLKHFSTDIFESLHKDFKGHLISSSNYKNIVKTMFNGISCAYSYNLKYNLELDKPIYSAKKSSLSMEALPDCLPRKFKECIFVEFDFIKYGSFLFKKGFFIPKEKSNGNFVFFKIYKVVSTNGTDYLIGKNCLFDFCNRLSCYELHSVDDSNEILSVLDVWFRPLEPYKENGQLYILPACQYFE